MKNMSGGNRLIAATMEAALMQEEQPAKNYVGLLLPVLASKKNGDELEMGDRLIGFQTLPPLLVLLPKLGRTSRKVKSLAILYCTHSLGHCSRNSHPLQRELKAGTIG